MMDAAPARARPVRAVIVALALLAAAFLAMDLAGWPGLATPMSRVLSGLLDRRVEVSPEDTRFHFLGRVEVNSPRLWVAASPWSGDPHFLVARDVALRLGYRDLWRAWRGAPLHVNRLEAGAVDLRARRLADGRGSWPLGERPAPARERARPLPDFGHLAVANGWVAYADQGQNIDLRAHLRTHEGERAGANARPGLTVRFAGRFRGQPLAGTLASSGVIPLVARDGKVVPVSADAQVAGTLASFAGDASDVLSLRALRGRFLVAGASLGETGALVGVTLPSTGRFRIVGNLDKMVRVWRVLVRHAEVGDSHLSGNFEFDPSGARPRLTGRLLGRQVRLADLAPSIGAAPGQDAGGGRVLPDQRFDLAALNRMDADLRVELERLELGRVFARPIAPLRLDLLLERGVLSLRNLSASTADGLLRGDLSLDGGGAEAVWRADLSWHGVRLEKWLRQPAARGAPPYIAGALDGRLRVTGRGVSTADILATLEGDANLRLRNGRVSHLVVEAAGIDLAQALGVAVRGDAALPVGCAVARARATSGVLRVDTAVLDTRDSTLSLSGKISLARERLDLKLIALPKDFSPLTLRAPVRVEGSLGAPRVALDGGGVAARLGGSALLALVSPWAALIPLMDPGDDSGAADRSCLAVLERVRAAASAQHAGQAKRRP